MIPENNETLSFAPVDGENLESYVKRLIIWIAENDGQLQAHVTWWTHRQPAPCPVCNYSNMSRYICDILQDIVNEIKPKKLYLKAEKMLSTTNPYLFEFKLHPKHR